MLDRHRYKDSSLLNWETLPDAVSSKKYDGAAFAMKIGPTGDISYISRRMSVKGDYPNRTEKVPHLARVPLPNLAGNIYHVELVHSGNSKSNQESHPAVSGILNSLAPRALATQSLTGPVRAVLLDVIHPKLPTFKDKIEHLKQVEKYYNNPDILFTPEYIVGNSNIKKHIKTSKDLDQEGVVVTSLTLPEDENIRVKIKHKLHYNLRVIGITQEVDKNGILKNSAGALVLADSTGKEVGTVGTGFDRKTRQEIWENRNTPNSWMNKLIQVEAMDPTASRLRHTVYNGLADGEIDKV
jgi:hypothetical protein